MFQKKAKPFKENGTMHLQTKYGYSAFFFFVWNRDIIDYYHVPLKVYSKYLAKRYVKTFTNKSAFLKRGVGLRPVHSTSFNGHNTVIYRSYYFDNLKIMKKMCEIVTRR